MAGDAEGHGTQQEVPGGGAAEDLRGECGDMLHVCARAETRAASCSDAKTSGTFCCPSQKAGLTVEENVRLKTRLQAAEAEGGPRQASSAEQDYEEVIQLLEAEIRDLKNQLATKRQARGVEATKVSLKLSVFTCILPYFIYLNALITHRFGFCIQNK